MFDWIFQGTLTSVLGNFITSIFGKRQSTKKITAQNSYCSVIGAKIDGDCVIAINGEHHENKIILNEQQDRILRCAAEHGTLWLQSTFNGYTLFYYSKADNNNRYQHIVVGDGEQWHREVRDLTEIGLLRMSGTQCEITHKGKECLRNYIKL